MNVGDVVVVKANRAYLKPGTRVVYAGRHPDSGNAIVVVDGRPVALTDDEYRQEGEAVAPARRPCTVPGCGQERNARGLCNTHYHQYRRGALDLVPPEPDARRCAMPGCEELAVTRGLCNAHYLHVKRGNIAHPDPSAWPGNSPTG